MRLFGGIGRRNRDPHAVGPCPRLEISKGEDPDGEPRAPFVAKKLVGFDPTAYADVAQLVRKRPRYLRTKLGRGKAAREREKSPARASPSGALRGARQIPIAPSTSAAATRGWGSL